MANQLAQDRQEGCDQSLQVGDRAADRIEIAFTLRVENWWPIMAAYGVGACVDVASHVAARLADLIGGAATDADRSNWVFANGEWLDVRLPYRLVPAGEEGDGRHYGLALDLCAAVAVQPFVHDGWPIHVALSCHAVRARRVAFGSGSGAAASINGAAAPFRPLVEAGGLVSPDEAGIRQYRLDMEVAGELLPAIADQGPEIAWQAVRSTSDPCEVLYYEALYGQAGEGAGADKLLYGLAALDRLGLGRFLDQRTVHRVIDQLEIDLSVTLAANISARSAVFDQWWMAIERRLLGRRDIARRLVIEITETAETSPSQVTAFLDRMRGLGCRIALDGFGIGFASIRQLIALSPDIVKVDAYFVRRAGQSEQERQVFTHIVGLARAIAPLVIVEGVESDVQRKLTVGAGAEWLQGAYSGRPTMVRTWAEAIVARPFGGQLQVAATDAPARTDSVLGAKSPSEMPGM